jgi:hypothetical protein
MATQKRTEHEAEVVRPALPPPVEGGTGYLESLGSFIDNLFGDRRMRRHAEQRIAAMFDEAEVLDPSPSPIPPPVD